MQSFEVINFSYILLKLLKHCSLIQHDAGYVTIAENAPGLSAEEEVRNIWSEYI